MAGIFRVGNSYIKVGNNLLTFGNQTGSGSGSSGTPQPLAISSLNIALPTNYTFGNMFGVSASGGKGQYTYSLSQPGITDTTYAINSTTGVIVFNGSGAYTAGRVDNFTVTVTDGSGATASAACTVTYQTAGVIVAQSFLSFYNSQSTDTAATFIGINVVGPGFAAGSNTTVTVVDPTGFFNGTGYVDAHDASSWPAPGKYPITLSAPLAAGGTYTQAAVIEVIADNGPTFIDWTQTNTTLTSSQIAGTVVGQALGSGSAQVTTYAIAATGNAYQKYSINGYTGLVSVAGNLTAGTDQITIVATRNGISFSQSVGITVAAGNILPAYNMTMTVAQNITNAILTSGTIPVGTPVVTGITGTPVWTLVSQTNYSIGAALSGTPPIFACNPSTGAVYIQGSPSAMTYNLELSVTDGINTCTQSFSVPVSAVVGPTLYVGEGMSTQYPSTLTNGVQGFEHWAPLYTAMNQPNSVYSGATVYVYSNSDPNYYANDNLDSQDQARFGLCGPVTIIGMQGSGGIRPRWGGPVGCTTGGVDSNGKGFFVNNEFFGGDISISNIEFSDIHSNGWQGVGSPYPNSQNTGCGVRQNSNVYGNMSINNCYFHDCDQGIETGDVHGWLTITNSEFYNNGGTYVSSGATHNIYIGGNAGITIDNILSWQVMNGHTFKSRAMGGTISNSRFYDGEKGGCSNLIDLCDGGVYTVSNCVLHRGAQAQNPYCLEWCEDMSHTNHPYPINTLLVENCTFINNTPNGYPGGPYGIGMWGQCMVVNGSYNTTTAINNTYIGFQSGNQEYAFFSAKAGPNVTGVSDGRPSVINSTGMTISTTQPALNFANPQTATRSPRNDTTYVLYDGENRNNWVNYFYYVIDPGIDDMRFSASGTAIHSVLFTPIITPTTYWASQPSYVNPFANGGTWSIVAGAGPYVGGTYTVAPVGKYTINTSTGALSINETPTAGQIDNIIISCTANGTTQQTGFYIVWT